ncbi:MAG: hypothetical protein D6704_10215 [Nitrospirae bacterium]|nr:MAG: hypothetical protein D6704_10215 [Nitrospirota bacterium]
MNHFTKEVHDVSAIGSLSVCMGIAGVAQAAPLTFFGEDLGLGEGTRLPAHPNADAAQAAFLSNLVGVGTEDFESFADGTSAPLTLTFPGVGTATLMGSGNVNEVPTGTNGVGRYPISGTKYWETGSICNIEFSNPVAAFGFFGIDIRDFGGQVTLTLQNGSSTTLTIPNTINGQEEECSILVSLTLAIRSPK